MKKTLSLVLSCALLLFSLAACGSNSDYLSWKSADYNSASDSEKIKCVETFINATLKSQGSDELSGDSLTASAEAVQEILKNGLDTYPDKTVQEIIDTGVSSSAGSAE